MRNFSTVLALCDGVDGRKNIEGRGPELAASACHGDSSGRAIDGQVRGRSALPNITRLPSPTPSHSHTQDARLPYSRKGRCWSSSATDRRQASCEPLNAAQRSTQRRRILALHLADVKVD